MSNAPKTKKIIKRTEAQLKKIHAAHLRAARKERAKIKAANFGFAGGMTADDAVEAPTPAIEKTVSVRVLVKGETQTVFVNGFEIPNACFSFEHDTPTATVRLVIDADILQIEVTS